MLKGKQSDFNLDEAIGFLIYRTARRIRAVLQKTYKDAGFHITPEQFTILKRINEHNGMTQSDLADQTFRDKANITRILDRIIQMDLIERHPNENDRRCFSIYLTPKGKKTIADMTRATLKLTNKKDVYHNFTKEEKNTLIKLINKFYENLDKEEA